MTRWSWAAVAAVLVIAIIAFDLFSAGPASAHYAQISAVSGKVEVTQSGNTGWHEVTGNAAARVFSGERIRTEADSGATLVFFDGSRTEIGPGTDVMLTQVNGKWGSYLQVEMTQSAGTTTSSVVPLKGATAFFRVDTPSGQASVHGTDFDVTVDKDGETLFAVTQGKVQVSNAQSQVVLVAGQATSVLPGQAPETPAYQFRFSGQVTDVQGGQWTVAGQVITVDAGTKLFGSPKAGDLVYVQGRVSSTGAWVADRVSLQKKNTPPSRFTGLIESMPGVPGTWMIGGHAVQVETSTQLSQGLNVGSPVQVRFTVSAENGAWLAQSITLLEEDFVLPDATPSAEVTGTAIPDATDTGTPEAGTPTATVEPKNDTQRCENRTDTQPEAQKLADQYTVPVDEVMSYFCKGFGFGEIDQAYSLSLTSGKSVSEILSMRNSGLGWGQIRQQLEPTATPKPTKTPKVQPTQAANGNGNAGGNSGNNGNGNNGNNGNGNGNGKK
jgi:hypothetical protein